MKFDNYTNYRDQTFQFEKEKETAQNNLISPWIYKDKEKIKMWSQKITSDYKTNYFINMSEKVQKGHFLVIGSNA